MNKKDYWTKEQDEILTAFLSATNHNHRNRYFRQLYPIFNMMAEIILKRYFSGNLAKPNTLEPDEYINDAVTYLSTRLHAFNAKKGKGFSYVQKIIKNFYIDSFRIKKLALDVLPLDNTNPDNWSVEPDELDQPLTYPEELTTTIDSRIKEHRFRSPLTGYTKADIDNLHRTMIRFFANHSDDNANPYALKLFVRRNTEHLSVNDVNTILRKGLGLTFQLTKIIELEKILDNNPNNLTYLTSDELEAIKHKIKIKKYKHDPTKWKVQERYKPKQLPRPQP